MNNKISRAFLVFGALSLLVAPACSSGDSNVAGSASLAQGDTEGPATTSTEEEDEPPRPGDPDCAQLEEEVMICFESLEQTCNGEIEGLDHCVGNASAACEPLWMDVEHCIQNNRHCDAELDAAHTCAEDAERACEMEHQALQACSERCEIFAHDVEAACGGGEPGPGDTCGHLEAALDACHHEGRGPQCELIEHALIELCGDCHHPGDEGEGHGHSGEEEGEDWPGEGDEEGTEVPPEN